jgi:hypothetical protein
MSIHDLKKTDSDTDGSKTYIEFQSDGSDAQRKAYRLASRGGKLREGVEDIDELYARLTPLLADVLFENDPSGLLQWVELTEEHWEAYQESLDEE